MLIDHAKIYIFAGSGGNGCQSLFKDIFHRRGTPDGGDGGPGGDVIIQSDLNLHTLLDFRYNQHYKAERGKHGGSNRKYGRSGADLIIKVPVGTIVKDADTDMVMRDLASVGETVVAARGGAGGKGSAKFDEATPGEPGVTRTLILELKLVADVGIVGFPNVGKSTLVSRVSKSRSKIAPYPFTTRSPQLGVVKAYEDSFVIADMPGLIEGAHAGKGLGDRFLRHIERTSVLIHLVDILPLDGSDPVENYFKLEKELELYGEGVNCKPRVVAVNKMDMTGADESLERFTKSVKGEVIPVSAVTGDGVARLMDTVYRKVSDVRKKTEENNGKDRDESSY